MRRSGRTWAMACAAVVALTLLPGRGAGQVTITKLNDLAFGQVTAGIAAEVRYSDPGAAKFQVQGAKNGLLLLTLMVPSGLSGPGASLPFSTTATSGAWNTQDRTASATTFNPTQPQQVRTGGTGRVYVWIGGRLTPPISQAAGTYGGTLTLSAVQQ